MTIVVIGACGRTGRLICNLAVREGHKVIGLARRPCELDSVEFVKGDALTYPHVEKAIKGADAVVSVIGHMSLNDTDIQTRATKNIIKAMEKHGVKRLISLTGSGVRVEGDKTSFIDRYLNLSLKLLDNNRIQDGIDHYEVIKESKLDWTVLRVLKLTNGISRKNYSLTKNGPAKSSISRKSVAKIILGLAKSKDWNKQAPIVSKKSRPLAK